MSPKSKEQIYEEQIFDDDGESTDDYTEVKLSQYFEVINTLASDSCYDLMITPEMYEEIKNCKVGEYVEFSNSNYPNNIKRIK